MPDPYVIRFARVVILEKVIEAESLDDAENEAWEMECNGQLLLTLAESVYNEYADVSIEDYPTIWDIREGDQ